MKNEMNHSNKRKSTPSKEWAQPTPERMNLLEWFETCGKWWSESNWTNRLAAAGALHSHSFHCNKINFISFHSWFVAACRHVSIHDWKQLILPFPELICFHHWISLFAELKWEWNWLRHSASYNPFRFRKEWSKINFIHYIHYIAFNHFFCFRKRNKWFILTCYYNSNSSETY